MNEQGKFTSCYQAFSISHLVQSLAHPVVVIFKAPPVNHELNPTIVNARTSLTAVCQDIEPIPSCGIAHPNG